MNEPIESRESLWDDFLARWPLEKLGQMTLEEYTDAGNTDCFVYWLEARTESLGSIWGGSAFKFGVYSRKDKSEKKSEGRLSYNEKYAWYTKYGDSPQTAFQRVRAHILDVAMAAQALDFDAIRSVDLGCAYKWKIAFLYQNRQQPQLVPVYSAEHIAAYLGEKSKNSLAPLQKAIGKKRGNANIFAFGDEIWNRGSEILNADTLKPNEAVEFFKAQPERFNPTKPPTKYIAGFETLSGQQIAITLNNKATKLWLEPGDWLDSMQSALNDIEHYAPDRSRNSNLAANTPNLGQGHSTICVTVPNRTTLIALCEAYENMEVNELASAVGETTSSSIDAPLNQILYGPPGTGKTYATIDNSLAILDPDYLAEHQAQRTQLKQRFDALVQQDRIRFVTFHQSFSYEDFVEGLRAITDEASKQLSYEVVDGVFKSLCDAAAAKVTQQMEAPADVRQRRVWKMSLGNTLGDDASIYQECLAGGYVLLGYGTNIDFSGCTSRQQVQARFAQAGVVPENPTTDYAITSVTAFVTRMKKGDLIVVSDGNFKFRAIGEVIGDYRYKPHTEYEADYSQMRPVKWLRQYQPSLPHTEILNNQFSQMTLYELRIPTLNPSKFEALLASAPTEGAQMFNVGQRFGQGYVVRTISNEVVEFDKPRGGILPLPLSIVKQLLAYVRADQIDVDDIRQGRVFEKITEADLEKYIVNGYQSLLASLVEQLLQPIVKPRTQDARVLIIDEINRGNISRIFGELITLIEPSKRDGAAEALTVQLPYSKKPFSVPANVYLIGTMNTADRSLASLDIALRRRFVFREMPPQPELLDKVIVEGVNIGQLLRVMNQRIEVLLDRDHCLGHAYFIALRDDPSLVRLATTFRNQIVPLLQEYFFEDWQRIQWVLNDHRKTDDAHRFLLKPQFDTALLFGTDVDIVGHGARWQINSAAFEAIESYSGIIAAGQ